MTRVHGLRQVVCGKWCAVRKVVGMGLRVIFFV